MSDQRVELSDLLRAAQLYYLDGLTQAAVADRLGCTRWTVSRMLTQARDAGIVQLDVKHPKARIRELERDLVQAFDLRAAWVVPAQQTAVQTIRLAVSEAADFVRDMRPRHATVAFGWAVPPPGF